MTKVPNNKGKKYKRTAQDPRVAMFKQFFLSPTSHTFWNIRASGIRAGYTEEYASNISSQKPQWWTELIDTADYNRAEMLQQAEKNLNDTLKAEPETDTMIKLKHDATKFVTERLGKEHYSTRKEITDKGGRRLFGSETSDSHAIKLENLFIGVQTVDNSSE
jgi:hypothetical protein